MKKQQNQTPARLLRLMAVLVALAALTVGVTLAYLFDTTDAVENTFTPGKVTCEVTETFEVNSTSGQYVKSDVQIKNTGDTAAYIRASVIVTWVKTDGNGVTVTHSKVPSLGTDFTISEGDSSDTDYKITNGAQTYWIKGADGFWYYTQPVPVDDSTAALFKECKLLLSAQKPGDDYVLSVEIVATAIQATPTDAVLKGWDSAVTTVDDDGTLVINPYVAPGGDST